MKIPLRIVLITLSAALSACGGGAAPAAPSPAAPTTPVTSAAFTIVVPPKSVQARSRSPKYISTNTQSVVITLVAVDGNAYTGSPSSIATNLTVSSPACVLSGSNLICTVRAPAVAGNDSYLINTYDVQQSASSPATPAGNVLSTATVPLTVTAGTNTTSATPLVLNGVVNTITATFAADPHISGSAANGYSIVGNQPYTLAFTAKDASGATIVGTGAPMLTSADSAVAITAVDATTYTVQVNSYSATPVAVTLSPAITGEPSFSLNTVQELWVTNGLSSSVTGYALVPGAPAAIAADTITAGLTQPLALAFDKDARLWVGDGSALTVTQYVPGTNSIVATIHGVGEASGVAFDPAGNMWISDFGGAVREFAPVNNAIPIATIAPIPFAYGIAFAPNGNFWVAYNATNTIAEYSGTTATGATVTNGVSGPQGVAFGPAGNLWVSNVNSGTITEYAPPYGGTRPFDAISSAFTGAVAFDGDGNAYSSSLTGNSATAFSKSSGFALALPGFPIAVGTRPHGVAIAP